MKKENLRRLFAAAFVVVLLAEWGTHAMMPSDSPSSDAPAISAADERHGDPCDLLILCHDNGRRDQQTQSVGREVTQHNALLDVLAALRARVAAPGTSQIEFCGSDGLFRSVDPPFHPPELS